MNQVAPQEQLLPFAQSSQELAQHILVHPHPSGMFHHPNELPILSLVGNYSKGPDKSLPNRIMLNKAFGNSFSGLDILVGAITSRNEEVSAFMKRFSEEDLRFGLALGAQHKILFLIAKGLDPSLDTMSADDRLEEMSFYQDFQRRLTQRATPTPQQTRK